MIATANNMKRIALLSCMSLLALSHAKVVPFEITLTWETAAPDGFEREVILTNGQLPGPPLYVNQGDAVEILLRNRLPFDITIHFHGRSLLNSY
jgi:FtsP/CotA-like multicopper oxidase with cupredoxin domain